MCKRKESLFQKTYAATGSLAAAARAADIPLDTARRLRDEVQASLPGLFSTAVDQDETTQLGPVVAALEAEAMRRALTGVEVPVFHQGRECGNTVKHSDTLLMFLLKTLKPDRYGGGKDTPPTGQGRAVLLDIDLSAADGE